MPEQSDGLVGPITGAKIRNLVGPAAEQFVTHGARRCHVPVRAAGFDQGLGFMEQLLAQLLARMRAGSHDLDVLVGSQAPQEDQLAGGVYDNNRLAPANLT